MPVQNFLEDEDYEADTEQSNPRSSVPNFLQDEEYDDTTGEEYYGGGYSDGLEADSGDGDESYSYGDGTEGEDELFDGGDLFGADGEDDGGPSYGISGLPPRPVPVSTPSVPRAADPLGGNASAGSSSAPGEASRAVRESSPTTEGTESTAEARSTGEATTTGARTTGASGATPTPLSGSVPNFLEDEDELPPPRVPTEVRENSGAVAPGAGSVPRAESHRGSSGPSAPSEAVRPRRDLSRPAPGTSAPAPAVPPNRDSIPTRALRDPQRSTEPQRSTSPGVAEAVAPQSAPPTVAVRFDPQAAVEPVTPTEAKELRAPSSYADSRELKFTALRQSDATVRKVGKDGLTPAERARAARATTPSSSRTPTNGKLSQEELLFYANMGSQRAGDYGSSSKKQLFTPPVFGESADEKREREARINRALAGGSMERGSKTRLTEKDYRVLQFIAIFKFVSERQIAKLLQVAEHSAYKRLNLLRKHGLTKSFKTLGVKGSVWVLTETGMDLSGYELPRGTESALTLSMVSHQFTVNHVAAHLWAGGANVLREKNFPQRNLPDGAGGFGFGEQLVSELQIQSAFGKVRGSTKADAYVPQIKKHMANQFDSWQRAGGSKFGPSPELQRGNEYMWTLFPPISNRLNYHVPDLVVARPRDADGRAQSIAVEVELRTKADDSSYERTLDAYRADDRLYRKVVWICRLKGTAEKLSRIAKRNGLADQGRITIVPIYLEDGSMFTGKDTWSL